LEKPSEAPLRGTERAQAVGRVLGRGEAGFYRKGKILIHLLSDPHAAA
jgi:hypothetical protein